MTHYRPSSRLCLPLQTGNGFAMSLVMFAFWMLALTLLLVGLLLLVLGHWILGPVLALTAAFFLGAFASFPRAVWVSRPCDLVLDAHGFRVAGGHRHGRALDWESLDASASGVTSGPAVGSEILFAATRDGKKLPLAEGDEHESFAAVLDAFRASAGLEPLEAAAVAEPASDGDAAAPAPRVELVRCPQCGAVARPYDTPQVQCSYCGHSVQLPETLRTRLREFGSQTALGLRGKKLLERALSQPRAPLAMALLGTLALAMLATWLFDWAVLARAIVRRALDFQLVLWALAAPLLVTLALCLLAAVVAARRVAVRAISVDFAAMAPPEPGKPCGCRVCGAPLPEHEALVVRCAYCSSPNIIATARPRRPHLRSQVHSLSETLEAQSAEQWARYIFLALFGAPALWAAAVALRHLWSSFGV